MHRGEARAAWGSDQARDLIAGSEKFPVKSALYSNEPAVITLALSKGRIFDETLPLLASAGIRALDDPDGSRKLVLRTSRRDLRLLIVRASDVPTYVQYGAAELGVAGKDVLLEHSGDGLYQPLDLGIAACRMVVAVPEGFDYAGAVRSGAGLSVGTKYKQTARQHLAAEGVGVHLLELLGLEIITHELCIGAAG